MKKEKN